MILNKINEEIERCQNTLLDITVLINSIIANNNIEFIKSNNFYSELDYSELYENIIILFDECYYNDILFIYELDFQDSIKYNVFELLNITFIDILNDEDLNAIYNLVDDIKGIYFNNFIIKRSNSCSMIKIINTNEKLYKLSRQLEYLKNIPQPEQRTTEWYNFRHNILTASNIWKAFDSESNYNQLIYEKCKPIDINKYTFVSTGSPMHWGQKYEPVSILWYEYYYNTKISEFGCIKHNTINALAASPDGINTDINSERYGRMLEIKNIVNREINGIPKKEYWIQMQLQMETCDLDECDFLETKFTEYENEEDFYKDGMFNKSLDNCDKGVIIYFIKDEYPLYEYAPFKCSKQEFDDWEQKIMIKNKDLTWMKNIYWKLNIISCVLVERNKLWFNSAIPIIEKIWDTIEFERINGYSHRQPKKRKLINKQTNNDNIFNKCMIDISDDMQCD